ncbi:MAG: hypothetical protein M1834_001413 [Cirrosporium novae-zelandiae]|nr:MAG: hypothetical protein M1834_001413 [Cirrosporium novae-zelandiae]
MALVGNMIASAFAGNPSIINYDMFVAVFAMLSLFYLIAADYSESFIIHPMIMLGVDALNTIFFFCGAVAMAAKLQVHSCSNESYTSTNSITNGASNTEKRCREAQASTAFLWFGFACFATSLILTILGARSSSINMRSGGIRRGGPAMSQV